MHAYIPLATLLSFVAMGAARNFVVPLDVPAVCRANAFCVRTFVFSGTCNGQNRDDDGYVSCVCAIPDAQLALNSCATCAAQYGSDDDDDVTDLMEDCGWTYTSATAAEATATTGATTATGTAVSTTTAATTATGSNTATTTGTSVTTSLASGATEASVVTSSVAAMAPAHTAMAGGALAGLVMGALAMM